MTDVVLKHILVAVKIETVEGTDAFSGAAPAAGEWVAAYGSSGITEQRVKVRDTTARPFHSMQGVDSYGSHCDVVVEVPLTGKDGVAGSPPHQTLDALLKASGAKAVVDAGVSVTYNWITFHTIALAPTVTVYTAEFLSDGTVKTHRTTGVRFDLVGNAADTSHVRLGFTGKGRYSDPDETPIAAPSNPASYTGGKSPILSQGMTLAFDAESFDVRGFTFGTAWALEEDRSISGSTSLDGTNLVRPDDQPMIGSMDFARAASLEFIQGKWKADTPGTLAGVFTDGTDIVSVGGKVQFGHYTKTKGNVYAYAVPLEFIQGSSTDGEDDLTLEFT